MATSGRRQSGVGRKTDLRRELHVAERLIAVGTTPHEASTRNVQKMAQSALLSIHNRQKKDGSAGKSSVAKYEVESTSTAPNRKLARQTQNKESEYGGGHRKTDKNRTNNSCRMGGKKTPKRS